jgi:hypothetical protein
MKRAAAEAASVRIAMLAVDDRAYARDEFVRNVLERRRPLQKKVKLVRTCTACGDEAPDGVVTCAVDERAVTCMGCVGAAVTAAGDLHEGPAVANGLCLAHMNAACAIFKTDAALVAALVDRGVDAARLQVKSAALAQHRFRRTHAYAAAIGCTACARLVMVAPGSSAIAAYCPECRWTTCLTCLAGGKHDHFDDSLVVVGKMPDVYTSVPNVRLLTKSVACTCPPVCTLRGAVHLLWQGGGDGAVAVQRLQRAGRTHPFVAWAADVCAPSLRSFFPDTVRQGGLRLHDADTMLRHVRVACGPVLHDARFAAAARLLACIAAAANTQSCPSCGTEGVKLDDTCTHMMCTVCATPWCYVCTARLPGPDKFCDNGCPLQLAMAPGAAAVGSDRVLTQLFHAGKCVAAVREFARLVGVGRAAAYLTTNALLGDAWSTYGFAHVFVTEEEIVWRDRHVRACLWLLS